VGKVFAPPFRSQVPGDVSAALVINTIFGPLSVGGAVEPQGINALLLKWDEFSDPDYSCP